MCCMCRRFLFAVVGIFTNFSQFDSIRFAVRNSPCPNTYTHTPKQSQSAQLNPDNVIINGIIITHMKPRSVARSVVQRLVLEVGEHSSLIWIVNDFTLRYTQQALYSGLHSALYTVHYVLASLTSVSSLLLMARSNYCELCVCGEWSVREIYSLSSRQNNWR